MEAKVAVYESQEKALNAVKRLAENKFPLKEVSLVGQAEMIEDHMHLKSAEPMVNAPLAVGTILGTVAGILTGIGIFAIPGFGFLYGAGAIIGALGGFDFGLVGGGIITLFASLGINQDAVVKYEKHMREGKCLLIIKASLEEIEKAERILHTEGTHLEFN